MKSLSEGTDPGASGSPNGWTNRDAQSAFPPCFISADYLLIAVSSDLLRVSGPTGFTNPRLSHSRGVGSTQEFFPIGRPYDNLTNSHRGSFRDLVAAYGQGVLNFGSKFFLDQQFIGNHC